MKTHATLLCAITLFISSGCVSPPVIDGGDLGYKLTTETGKFYPQGDEIGAPFNVVEHKTIEIDVENPNNSEGAEMSIGPDGSLSSENSGSFMSEGERAAIFWGGLIFAIMGVFGIVARFTWNINFPFGIGVMMIGVGSTAIFLDAIANAAGVTGVLMALTAATLAAWFVSSTSMGRDAKRALEAKLEGLS